MSKTTGLEWIDELQREEELERQQELQAQQEQQSSDVVSVIDSNAECKLEVFRNSEFGDLNTIVIDGEPWFIGKEVAEKLGYSNTKKAINTHIEIVDKMVITRTMLSKDPKMGTLEIPNRGLACINESGLYSLILSSKLESAKRFKHWITSDVLPSIRKHGAYMTEQTLEQALLSPDFLIQLASKLKEEQEHNKRLTQRNKELATTNAALSKEINTWNPREILNSLVRSYALKACSNKVSYAWGNLYKKVEYKLHINLRARKDNNGKRGGAIIDTIRNEEWNDIVAVAVAMCEEVGIDVGKVIGKTNVEMLKKVN
jgi:prophage antirepressor-like protein